MFTCDILDFIAEKAHCEGLDVAHNPDPAADCPLTSGKRHRSRHYWKHIQEAGIHLPAFYQIRDCPFEGPFYQIMRQFMLGAYLKQAEELDAYEIISMSFSGNTSLMKIPPELQPLATIEDTTIIDAWNRILRCLESYSQRCITHATYHS